MTHTKAVIIDIMKRKDPVLPSTSGGAFLVLANHPKSYKDGISIAEYLLQEIIKAGYQNLSTLTIFIEEDVYSFGVALSLIRTFKEVKVRVVCHINGGYELVDLWDFVDDNLST